MNDLRLRLKLDSKRAKREEEPGVMDDIAGLSVSERVDGFISR
jgi:twitching motility protein PilU